MDDRLRETLSAMMDDEADELSVRRLLSHANQGEVRDQWQRWQQVRDLMHENHGPAEGLDIASAVREQLDGRSRREVAASEVARSPRRRWHMPVAAMVVMALVDRKSTRLNSSHVRISYAVFCLKKKNK